MSAAFRAVSAFSAFGKLPSRADFVHIGPGSELSTRFGAWLTHGVEWAHVKGGSDWGEAFRSGTLRAFIYRGDVSGLEQALMVGALAPSRDQAGRLFPICVAASVIPSAEFVMNPHLLPFACEGIWQVAGERLDELSSNPSADLGARLLDLAEPVGVNFSDAAAAYAAWCDALELSELGTLITSDEQLDVLLGIVRLTSEAVQPVRRQERPTTPLSLRFPLGAAGGAAVCFWLDVLRRLVGWKKTVPSVFWSQDGSSGQLTVHLGSAPVATISELWLPSSRSDEFCDLGQSLSPAALAALSPLPGAIERALHDRTASVAGLMAALSIGN